MALLGLVAIWQLAQGPIRLSFLNGFIEQALNPEGSSASVTLQETVLVWSRERNVLDVQALGVDLRDQEKRPLARIPELSVNFSGRALLRGLIAPQGLEIRGPSLRINLGGEGPVLSSSDTDTEPGGAGQALSFFSDLLQPPDTSNAAGYLTSVEIVNARLAVRDQSRNLAWDITNADLEITRDASGIRAESQLTVTANGVSGKLRATARHSSLSQGLSLHLRFEDLQPALLAHIEPSLDALERIDLPLAGSIGVQVDGNLQVQSLRYDIKAGAGTIDLPELYTDPVMLAGAVVRGSVEDNFSKIRVDNAEIDLGGPTATLQASIDVGQDVINITLDAEAREVPADELDSLWPTTVGVGARNWVTRNLETGVVHHATLSLNATAPADDPFALQVAEVGGVMDVTGLTVHYLRPMAPVLDVAADISYDASDFVIDVTAGGLHDLVVEEGTINLSLDEFDPVADIAVTIAGTITDALTILDMQPLGYASALGIDPQQMGGQQRTNATFRIPMRKNLSLDDIGVAAAAGITGFSQAQGLFGLPLTNGTLSLEVDTSQLTAWGNISLGDVPLEARWTERFNDDSGFNTRYEVSGIFDQPALKALGIDFGDKVEGAIGAGVSYAIFPDGRAVGAADLDLSGADISIPAIFLDKPSGEPATGNLSFSVDEGVLTDISRFEISSADLVATGAVRFAPPEEGGGIRQVGLSRLAYGENDLFGTVELAADGSLDINLGGQTLDLRPLVDSIQSPAEETSAPAPEDPDLAVRLTIDPNSPIADVRVGELTYLANVYGELYHDGASLRSANLAGSLVEPNDLRLLLTDQDRQRNFTLAADDAGALFDALDWTSALRGGQLVVEGNTDDTDPDAPITGRALVSDFQLTEAPLLGRILSLASLRGIANTLNGEGINFKRLEIPFEVTDEAVELPGIKLRGSQLGVLAAGRIDREAETIDLLGEVAPAYTINSLLGKIPIIGDVLTGGGDGVFAATYKVDGPLDSPNVSVNPLSILTPGFTRRILGGFGSGKPTPRPDPDEYPVDPSFEN